MLSFQILQERLKKALPDLITRIRGGDSSAKEEFAASLFPYIKILVSKYSSSINDVESFVGFIITKILSKLDKIDLSKSVLGYIVTSTNNYCIDEYRRLRKIAKKAKVISLEDKYVVNHNIGSTSEEQLKNIINDLFTTNDAKIISLHYIDNLSFDEIATHTGHTVQHIQETIELAQQTTFGSN